MPSPAAGASSSRPPPRPSSRLRASARELSSGVRLRRVAEIGCRRSRSRRLRREAVEDSRNGLRAAHAAGMRVLALPNPRFPPPPDALAAADRVLGSLGELTPEVARGRG